MELFERRADDAIVGVGRSGAWSAAQLHARAALVQSVLPPAAPGSAVAFAFGRDRGAFAAALLGTWAAGHRAALPPDARRESVTPVLGRSDVVAFLHDTGVGRGIDVPRLCASGREVPALSARAFGGDPEAPRLSLHDPLAVAGEPGAWSLRELAVRTDELARALAFAPGDAVASRAAPTFVPALLADLLLPLRHAGRFVTDVPGTTAETRACLAASEARFLVDSAIGLRHLAGQAAGALAPLAAVLCATPDRLDELALERLIGEHGLRFVRLSDVEARPGPAARVRAALWALSAVRDAEALVSSARPDEPYALVVTDDAGPSELELAAELAARGLPVAGLRRARDLWRDPNGRVDDADLLRAFGLRTDGTRIERELVWRSSTTAAESGVDRFETHVPASFAFYDGHFTTYAVMAGAVQLHELVLPCLRRLVPGAEVRKLDRIKFLARVAPGDDIALELRVDRAGQCAGFTILRGQERLSSGRLQWRERGHG